jgi:hypothetical protein
LNAHDGNNIALSSIAGIGAWLSGVMDATGPWFGENWAQLLFVAFGAVHAYIAWDKWRYERSKRDTE